MPIDDTHCLTSVHVPHNNKMIKAGAEEHILRYRMPFDISDASFVPLQLHQPLGQVSWQSAIGYVPQFYLGIKIQIIVILFIFNKYGNWYKFWISSLHPVALKMQVKMISIIYAKCFLQCSHQNMTRWCCRWMDSIWCPKRDRYVQLLGWRWSQDDRSVILRKWLIILLILNGNIKWYEISILYENP